MGINPLGDHVLTSKQHTGSICGHNHLMDVVASLSRDSKIGPVRVNHRSKLGRPDVEQKSDENLQDDTAAKLQGGFSAAC